MILYERVLPDGREISVLLMIFSYRICIGDDYGYGYSDGWCYPHGLGSAFVIAAAESWDGTGDPADGWVKHIGSSRRRPNGDPAQEYVEP